MLFLLGLTTICLILFIPRYLAKRLRISLFAVAVNARTGMQVARKDLSSDKRPKASRNAAFPFLPIPLHVRNKQIIHIQSLYYNNKYI